MRSRWRCASLCRPGDTVLVESPTYFGLLQAIEHLSLKVVEVPNCSVAGIDVDAVRAVARSTRLGAAVLMPNFNNPSGSLTPDDAKREIVADPDRPRSADHRGRHLRRPALRRHAADVAARVRRLRPGDLVRLGLEDDRFRLPHRLGGEPAVPRRDRARQILLVGRLPDAAATRAGALLRERRLRPVSAARALHARRATRSSAINAIARFFPDGTRVAQPPGGVVLWVELPRNVDGAELFRTAAASSIGVAPGVVFSAKADYRNYIRLSCGLPWTPTLERAVEKLGRLVAGMARAV